MRRPSCSASATTPLRRWADAGRFDTTADASGRRRSSDGADLARLAQELAAGRRPGRPGAGRLRVGAQPVPGMVTRVVRDTVMAQVEIQAGPHRVVSLMSREAADELGLEPGVLAVAAVKSTHVVVEVPGQP